jgi:hypothetical protein
MQATIHTVTKRFPQIDRRKPQRVLNAPTHHRIETPPARIPDGHIGPVVLGTGRTVYWTGRVAIGLRHEAAPTQREMTQSEEWVQTLMLNTHRVNVVAAH